MSSRLPRRLYRSRHDKMLGGVSAGLATYFDIDAVLVRLVWVGGAVLTGGLLAVAYVLLWIVVPQEDYVGPSSGVVRQNVNEMAAEARRVADDVREALRREPTRAGAAPADEVATTVEPAPGTGEATVEPAPAAGDATMVRPPVEPPIDVLSPLEAEEARRRRSRTAGVILLVLGLLFLTGNLGVFRWFDWSLFWPIILIGFGALLLWNRSRSGA